MNTKIHTTITLAILSFALIAAGVPTAFENVYAQGEDEDTGGITNGTTEHGNPGETTGEGGDTEGETNGEEP